MRTPTTVAALSIMYLLGSVPAEATCTYSAPMWHSFSYFACADFTPMADLAYQVDSPTDVTSGTRDIACEQESCWVMPGAGVIGDGRVMIGFSWNSPGTEGCPGDLGPGSIMHRVVIVIQASDGQGLIATLGRGRRDATYEVEAAHRLMAPNGLVFPLPCTSQAGRPQVLSREELIPGQVILGLHFDAPLVYSDCDPNTRGLLIGSCTDNFLADPSIGRIFTKIQPCSGRPDIRRSIWTSTGLTPDAEGNLTLTVPRPSGTECLYVGATSYIGGYESGAITGFIRVPGTSCADSDQDGWSDCEGDCADGQPTAYPGHAEVCDLLDNDCDGTVDEGQTTCGTGACQKTIADCVNGVPQPCIPVSPSPEVCDQIDNDCDGLIDEVDPDGDGYRCAADCDEGNPSIHVGATELCNGRDDNCDGRIDNDQLGEDSDGDGVHNVCDNCRMDTNPDQTDTDADRQGDACDLDDGLILLTSALPPAVTWQPEGVYSSFNLYRGDLDVLRQTGIYTQDPATVPLALRACGLFGSSYEDSTDPPVGKAVYYLLTGNCDQEESDLGTDSGGIPRPNSNPCPPIDLSNCPECDKPATRILHGYGVDGPISPEGYRVIDNAADWNVFCSQAGGAACSSSVDFTHQVAIVAAISGFDSCYDVEVSCVQTVGVTPDLHVVVERKVPGPGCTCLDVLIFPVDAVKVERPVGSVTFETQVVTLVCPAP